MPCGHAIPVGMMWVQTYPTPIDTPPGNPLYRQKLYEDDQVINNPAAAWSSYMACDRVIFEDKFNRVWTLIIDDWKAAIEAARAAGVKCSLGYIYNCFTGRPDSDINNFVDAICNITNVNDVVVSWHVTDEPLAHNFDPNAIRDLVKKFHDRQQLNNKNWPFHIALNADQEGTRDFWPVTPGGDDRYYDPDPAFQNYINAIAACPPNGAGAPVIISLFYYPWASNNWAYTVLPPWRKWRFIIEKFRCWYPNSTTHPIHMILEGGAKNTAYATHLPGHVDMHQQVRMARNYDAQGIWLWGWGNRNNPLSPDNLQFTMTHWVDSTFTNFYVSGHDERWGEAVANEVTAATEGLSAAIPAQSKIVATATSSIGFWIKYWVASRGKVEFRIHDKNGTWVRRLDLGYKNNTSKPSFSESWTNFYDSVAGKYEYTPGVDRGSGDNDLLGTAAHWDKKDGNNQDVPPANNPYTIHMYVNNSEVGCPVQVSV